MSEERKPRKYGAMPPAEHAWQVGLTVEQIREQRPLRTEIEQLRVRVAELEGALREAATLREHNGLLREDLETTRGHLTVLYEAFSGEELSDDVDVAGLSSMLVAQLLTRIPGLGEDERDDEPRLFDGGEIPD